MAHNNRAGIICVVIGVVLILSALLLFLFNEITNMVVERDTRAILEKIKNNIRQIKGTINKIAAMESLYGIAPTMGSIQQIIHDIETDNRPVSATVDDIIESVADKYDLTKSDLISEKRNANISLARNVSMYIIREVTGLSLENIGNKFGGKKHSTVKHSIDIVEERIMRDVKFKNTVYNIIKQFKDN